MAPAKTRATTSIGADTQLKGFIAKFEPNHQTLIRAVRKALRKRLPTACELVYENYNFFVIGYSPTERPSDSIVSVAAGANGVGLCFIRGASLRDPQKILHCSGNQTRFMRVESADVLAGVRPGALLRVGVGAPRGRSVDWCCDCRGEVSAGHQTRQADHSVSVSEAAAATQVA